MLPRSIDHWTRFGLGLVILFGLAILAYTILMTSRGFDLTDEGYYLNAIEHVAQFKVSTTQFGFVYRSLFMALGGDIAALRIANLTITFCLSGWLAFEVLRSVGPGRNALVLGLAATSVTVLNGWLPTPNYNSLVVQAAYLTAIGFCRALRSQTSIGGAGLIGVGGWLAFMAKPPSAAAFAVLVFVELAVTRHLRVRILLVAVTVAVGLILVSAIALDGAPTAFVVRLATAIEDGQILQGGYEADNLFRIDSLPLGLRIAGPVMLAVTLVTAALTLLVASDRVWMQWLARGLVPAALMLAALTVAVDAHALPNIIAIDPLWRAAPVGVAIGLFVGCLANGATSLAMFRRADIGGVILFAAMPLATSFGSNTNYWATAGCAAPFWTLAGLRAVLLLRQGRQVRSIIPAILVAQTLTFMLIGIWTYQPYRLHAPLIAQTTPVQIGHSMLQVTPALAEYVNTVRSLAEGNGWRASDPVIDLTGHSPGLLYALGAVPVGDPWVIGGYAGSDDYVRRVMARVPCRTIAAAWLLLEPGGQRAAIPEAVGLTLSFHEAVGQFQAPPSDFPTGRQQILYKPVGPQANRIAACERSR